MFSISGRNADKIYVEDCGLSVHSILGNDNMERIGYLFEKFHFIYFLVQKV